MPSKRFPIRVMALAVGEAEGLAGELAEIVRTFRYVGQGGGDQDAELGIDGDQAPVEGGVQGWAKGKAVADPVVAGDADGDDVAGFYQRRTPGGYNTHTGDGAGEIVNLRHEASEQPPAHKPRFLIVGGGGQRRYVGCVRFVEQVRCQIPHIASPGILNP